MTPTPHIIAAASALTAVAALTNPLAPRDTLGEARTPHDAHTLGEELFMSDRHDITLYCHPDTLTQIVGDLQPSTAVVFQPTLTRYTFDTEPVGTVSQFNPVAPFWGFTSLTDHTPPFAFACDGSSMMTCECDPYLRSPAEPLPPDPIVRFNSFMPDVPNEFFNGEDHDNATVYFQRLTVAVSKLSPSK